MSVQPAAPISPDHAQALWRAGGEALRAGDPAGALRAFRQILDGGRGDATIRLGVAVASRRMGDAQGALQALEAVLQDDPRHLRALLMKGEAHAEAGEALAAASFRKAALEVAADTRDLPADLATEVARARAALGAQTSSFEAHLCGELQRHGLDAPGARRVRDSLEMMLGRREIYLQQPTQYYFPELPQIGFYPREDTPWLAPVEAAFADIQAELEAVLADEGVFQPYVEADVTRARLSRGQLLGDPSWSAFYLCKGGEPVAANAARCPRTMAALERTPLCRIPGRTPSILFSLLRPGAHIPPHTGLLNTRLICHLPLVVPPGCSFRVGADTRPWREGEAFAFDDSIEHEAWNRGDSLRVVLIFDVWRPELTALERDLVSVMVRASKSLEGEA